ncbi:MAG: hypothetical protein EBS69_05785 [Verrucomicrobia bacterium]|nr:hypothetical protein [Verrucomicrobiota bacterium]
MSAPNGYEVSANGTDYLSSVTVGAAGTLSPTTISVRLASTTVPGTYTGNVVCSSLAATVVNVATASSTVDKKTITISGISAAPKPYDGSTVATISGTPGLVGLEGQDATRVALSSPLANFVSANAGQDIDVVATYSLTGAAASYYNLTQPSGLMAEIQKKPATIRANDQTKTAGTLLVLGTGQTTFTASGLISGERIASVTLSANGGTESNAPVGSYFLTPSDPVAPITIPANSFRPGNYAFTFVDGTLRVIEPPPTVTLDQWASNFHLTGDNALPSADPDGDGMSNLLEYYLGLDPTQSGGTNQNTMVVVPGSNNTVSMTYRRAKGITGVSAAVQASGDLSSANSWDANGVQETVTDKGDYEEVTATVTNPPGATKMFMRLKVSQP